MPDNRPSSMNPTTYWSQFDPPASFWFYCVAVLSLLIGVIGVLSNVLVIYYLLRSKRFKVNSNRYFLLNLAVSDILKVSLNIPFKASSNWNHRWLFGHWGCQIYGYVGGLSGFLSITTLTFMTIERYLMVKNPLNSLKDRSISSLVLIAFAWFYSVVLITFPLVFDKMFVLEGMLTSCTFDYLSRDLKSRLVVTALFIGGFMLPLTLIVIFYTLLIRILDAKARPLCISFHESNSIMMRSPTSSISSYKKQFKNYKNEENVLHETYLLDRNNRFESRIIQVKPEAATPPTNPVVKREIRVIRQILACVALFCVTWFPYAIVVLIAQFGEDIEVYINPLTATLPALFAKSSAVFNPLIYTLTNPQCRAFFKRLFKCAKDAQIAV